MIKILKKIKTKIKKTKNKIKSKIKKTKGFINRNRKLYFNRFKRLFLRMIRQSIIWFHFFAILRKMHFPLSMRKYKKLYDIKNTQQGKRCFIIATGPSLTVEDIEMLENEYTFSMNGIFRIFDKTQWRPTYYTLVDNKEYNIFKKRGNDMNFDSFCKDKAIISETIYTEANKEKEYEKTIPVPIFFTGERFERKQRNNFIFSKDLMWGFYSMWTVTTFAIVVASYMGFKDIYLLGCDCNYSGDKKYFDNVKNTRYESVDEELVFQQRMISAYEFINSHAKDLDVNIYNATRGGSLEVFERVNLEDVLRAE